MSVTVDGPITPDAPEVRKAASGSLIAKARNRDGDAIKTMFRQFIPTEEKIVAVEYLGSPGLIFKTHSFACVSDRRVASLRVKRMGEITYQDGAIESVNSAVLYQPSRISHFLSIVTLGLANLVPGRSSKQVGLVVSIGEGISVYILSHRSKVDRANGVYRVVVNTRERRLHDVESGAGSQRDQRGGR